MNFNFSIFGQSGNDISQFPVFAPVAAVKGIVSGVKRRQLMIVRTERIMTYTFVQRLSNIDVIGFRLSMNDMQISKPKALIEYFSKKVEELSAQGEIVRYGSTGVLSFCPNVLLEKPEVTAYVQRQTSYELEHDSLRFGLEKLHGLPQSTDYIEIDCSTSSDSYIEEQTYKSKYVRITDKKAANDSYLTGIMQTLAGSLVAAQKKIAGLEKDNAKLLRAKKQFTVVLLMLLLICAGGVWLYSLRGDLELTRSDLQNTETELRTANAKLRLDSLRIDSLEAVSSKLRTVISDSRRKLDALTNAAAGLHSTLYLPQWWSTNGGRNSSESYKVYELYCYPGDELTFDYYVDSERADRLNYSVSGAGVSRRGSYSGYSESGTVNVVFESEGSVTFRVAYSKDGSVHHYSDRARVSGIRLIRGDVKRMQEILEGDGDSAIAVRRE